MILVLFDIGSGQVEKIVNPTHIPKVGEKVTINTPTGRKTFEVVEVETDYHANKILVTIG